MRIDGILGLAAALVLSVGCGSPAGPELGTVQGTVTLDGDPLPDAVIQFAPNKGRPSTGTTDANGHYTLQYTMDRPGAVIGMHSVRVTTARTTEGEDGTDQTTPEKVPAKFNTESELTEEVTAGSNTIHIELTSEE